MSVVASADPRVWSGLTKSFTKPAGADPTAPQNQDHLTANVAFIRGSTQGLYNPLVESSYDDARSPVDTLWATDLNNPTETIAATNWANLLFDTWTNAYGGIPNVGNNIENRDAVVYLITDDIYLDLRFTDWGMGFGAGGRFTYLRAEVPEPATASLLAAGILGICSLRRPRSQSRRAPVAREKRNP
jgi:hypothetical protein